MKKSARRIKTQTRRKPKTTSTTRAKRKDADDSKRTKRSTSNSRKAGKGFQTGAAGFKTAAKRRERQEAEYERKKNTPWDFRLKPGDEAEVVILDNAEPFFVAMHTGIKDSRGRWTQDICIADTGEECPLCASLGKEGSYTMFLTVLDRRPYRIQQGQNAGKTIKVSKKLLPVKGRNLPKFQRQWERKYGKKPHKWRGLRIALHRSQEKESAIGEDIEFLGVIKESALKRFGEISQPADYKEIFEIPSADELRKRHNLDKGSKVGSEEFEDDTDDGYDLDDVGWDEDSKD